MIRTLIQLCGLTKIIRQFVVYFLFHRGKCAEKDCKLASLHRVELAFEAQVDFHRSPIRGSRRSQFDRVDRSGNGCRDAKGELGALIILKPKNEPWPSNLQGIVYCNKSLRRGLEHQAGFRAALRTRILKVAKERRMIAPTATQRC